MTISAKIVGGENLKAKAKFVLTTKGMSILQKANIANAKQFADLVRTAIPQDPESHRGAHLVDTLEQTSVPPTGAQVSIGTAAVPYPLHLETGHRARDGSHVPAKAYWFPAKRVVQKGSRARTLRSYRAAIKAQLAINADGGGGS